MKNYWIRRRQLKLERLALLASYFNSLELEEKELIVRVAVSECRSKCDMRNKLIEIIEEYKYAVE